MKFHKNQIFPFLSIILLTTILGFTSIYKMLDLSDITEEMYKYPFTSTNAIAKIETESVHIQHKMAIIMNTQKIEDIYKLNTEIVQHHTKAQDLYMLVYERFLGDVKDIDKSYNAFMHWEKLRAEIIDMCLEKNFVKAAQYKDKEALYVKELNILISTLKDFSHKKAIIYNDDAKTSKINAIIIISILLISIVILSTLIAIFVIRSSIEFERDLNRHFYLIEQNINIAKLNTTFEIIEVTESLARLFNLEKEALINHPTNLLLGSDNKQIQEITKIIHSGKAWSGEIYIENVAWIYTEIQTVLDDNYKISGYTMIIYDITSKKQLEIVSITDGMTGLYNRREFDKNFSQRLSLSKRESKTLVFMMLDIDFFKLFNDNYGHQAGDTALKNVASALKASFHRPDDAVYRLGGEEFGILFTANNEEGVEEISQQLLKNIEGLHIEHKYSSVCEYLTISIGVGIIQSSNTLSAEALYAEVDSALYDAKDSGRNRYKILTI